MNDILLEYRFTDRAGRGVYNVKIKQRCDTCGNYHFKSTGQQIRFDLDGSLRIKIDNVISFETTSEGEK